MSRRELRSEAERKGVSAEKTREYVNKLSQMINCKTVWTGEGKN